MAMCVETPQCCEVTDVNFKPADSLLWDGGKSQRVDLQLFVLVIYVDLQYHKPKEYALSQGFPYDPGTARTDNIDSNGSLGFQKT